MNPTRMAEKPMFPTHPSNPSDGEPDAVKVARKGLSDWYWGVKAVRCAGVGYSGWGLCSGR